jgi:hypothetical protein
MASKQEVRQYLAYWFQLGKKVVFVNGAATLQPKEVIQGDRYSQEFEEAWQRIISPNAGDCYLEGTEETIGQLLTNAWDMSYCARCSMPIIIRNLGMPTLSCPCNDLNSWPNEELPPPRSPVSSQEQLKNIRDRLVDNLAPSSSN